MSSTHKHSFFRQSGWMVIATFIGGIFMVSVQVFAKGMPKTDFNNFVALLGLLVVFGGVPAAALQTIYAERAAAAVTPEMCGELTASVRALLRSTFIFWLATAGLALVFAGPVCSGLGVNNTTAVRLAMLCVLPLLWAPILKGVLQGQHRFASLGWLLMVEGIVRLGTFAVLVLWLKGGAADGVWAVFTGQYLILAAGIWLTRDVWAVKSAAPFSWKEWLARGAPMTMGMGAYVFMTRLDNVFTKSLFVDPKHEEQLHLYNFAMFVGFAITQFIAPIAAVMFPTIVRSLALSKKTNALFQTLLVTGGFAVLAAVGCTVFPKLPLAVLHFSTEAAPLVPWFAWALLPLTLAYVLIQNLLAQGRYAAAPWLILVPVLYGLTLMAQGPALEAMPPFPAFVRVIQTLGLFCLLLFAVAAWFTWRKPARPAQPPA